MKKRAMKILFSLNGLAKAVCSAGYDGKISHFREVYGEWRKYQGHSSAIFEAAWPPWRWIEPGCAG
jgi:hypothetical protein